MSDGGSDNLAHYARLVSDAIRDWLQIAPPPTFEAMFVSHARRLGQSLQEELGSLVLIECYEAHRAGRLIDDLELRRILDRIRHRLTRSVQRHRSQPLVETAVVSGATIYPDALNRIVHEFINGLSAEETAVFSRYIDDRTPKQIAHDLDVSESTCYRTLARLRVRFAGFVEQLGLEN